MATWRKRLLVWCSAIFAACAFNTPSWAESGVLSVRLEGQGSDGAIYRLRDALFLIRGRDSTFVLNTEANSGAEVLSLDLRGGSYSIELMPGWGMERTANEQTTTVAARLTSDNPQTFMVTPAEVTEITYRFAASNMEPGQLRLGLAVELAPIDTPVPTACDPVAQTGCSADEKCTSVAVEENLFQTKCVAAGSRVEGDACQTGSDGESDDCAAGLFCVNGRCNRVCDTNAATPGCACSRFVGIFGDRESVGVCQPTCDVLAQDCPEGQSCYLRPVAGTIQQVCARPAGEGGQQGDSCQFLNSCDAGYNCVLSDPTNGGGQCAFACDALGGSPSCADGPGPAFTCVSMNQVTDGGLDNRLGFCVDCSLFPAIPACSN